MVDRVTDARVLTGQRRDPRPLIVVERAGALVAGTGGALLAVGRVRPKGPAEEVGVIDAEHAEQCGNGGAPFVVELGVAERASMTGAWEAGRGLGTDQAGEIARAACVDVMTEA